jgi:serine/threonine-protein phosphatase PGAM5
MQSTAEVIWQGRDEPLVFLDSLKEAHLFYLEGMKNGLFLLFYLLSYC